MAEGTTTARIRLALEGASVVEQGLSKVQSKVSDVGKTMLGLAGGLSAAGFAAWVKGAIDAADETGKVAQKTGLAVKEVSGLQLAWRQAGGSAEQFVPVMAKLGVAIANGNKSLDAMGVSSKKADGSLKSTREVLSEVSDKFVGYESGARKTALAVGLLGEEGAKALPFLNQGSQALADFDEMAQRLGLTISDEVKDQAEKFNDTLDLIGQSSQGVARQVAAQLLPTLTTLTQEFFNNVTQGDNLKKTADFLAGGLKGLYSVGVGVVEVFKTVGVALGGTGAAIAAIMSGEFGQAKEIVNMMRADISASWAAAGASIKRVWDGAGGSTVAALAAATGEAKRNAPALAAAGKASKAKADGDKEAAKAAKELSDTMAKVSALSDKLSEQYVKDADAVMEGNQSLREEIELIGLTTSQRAALLVTKEAEIIAGKELELISLKNADADAVTLSNLQREIELRQQRLGLLGQKTTAESAADLAEAEKKAFEESTKAQAEASEKFWASVDDTAHDVFVSVATEGEDAFKRIGKTIKAAVLDMLYQMTIKKWIIQISGQSTGGVGSAGSLLDSASSAYSAYSMAASGGAGSAGAAGSMSAIGSYAGGSMSGANAAGSIYANASGTGMNGLLATNGAYGTAASGAGASSASWMTAAWWAAVVVAAVAVAENLYSKGYNREAVGHASNGGTVNRFGNTSFTTDQNMGRSFQYDTGFERFKAQTLEWAGLSEKWVDILSGTTRMAATFGRKLGAYGFEANVAGGDASVGGFARYKGGLFRSNKTVGIDIDQRDAAAFDAIVESTIEGARAMAQAMGLSGEAIDSYTGKVRVNMKGADTAAEQSERMAKAMEDLHYSLLKTASGGKMARAEFERLMESVRADIEAAGISTQGIADILARGIVDGAGAAAIGQQLSEMILGGIYTTMAQQAFAPVAQALTAQIITPIFTAMAAGVPLSQAISKAAIANVVASAQAAAQTLNAVFSSAEFMGAIGGISQAIAGVSGAAASVRMPSFRAPTVRPIDTTAADTAREKEQLERELLRLQGNTVELRRRELLELKPTNRALQQQIWLLQDQQEAAEKLKDTWSSVMDAMASELRSLRDEILGITPQATAWGLADLTTAQAAAMAGDADAADRIPEIARAVLDLAAQTSASLSDLRGVQGYVYSVLQRTQQYASTVSGIPIPAFDVGTNYVPRDMLAMVHEGEAIVPRAYNPAAAGGGSDGAVVKELRAVREELSALKSINIAQAGTIARLQQQFDSVTSGGNEMRSKAVTV